MKIIRSGQRGTLVLLLVGVSGCAGSAEKPGETTQAIGAALTSAAPQGAATPDAAGKPPGARVAHRSRKDPAARTRATGRRELTPQEQERLDRTVPR